MALVIQTEMMKNTERKIQDHVSAVDNARPENACPSRKAANI